MTDCVWSCMSKVPDIKMSMDKTYCKTVVGILRWRESNKGRGSSPSFIFIALFSLRFFRLMRPFAFAIRLFCN